jgi:hypothetical protein
MGDGAVQRKTCEVCGHAAEAGELVIHRIVPEEVAKQAGIVDLRTGLLCFTCSRGLQDWYNKRVFGMKYDVRTNQFIPKSSAEMVKEYDDAYKAFIAYKKAAVKL